ncbi:aminodeoxychorismate/anthranilate synthase component II [Halodesulfurarchaeum sp. HSR-GB]|uniref:anthranilate synthase component II n=1 Tax=Halodesulfurarchaeum sp. HSR-GB TaxID=3074077 RepID=UPI00285F8839|nr:aminodeoxychorismate/anthranilate synthase component II [Halodesulfurarchaeum sp. HSR-GB]MDR5655879.1 aminodeoxychorismate/anthranilate synthase component II [Halodesulfurarchaeum sp. HSR-GB]
MSDCAPHLLVVDNYDSFAYNLVQYAGEFAGEVTVRRNDKIDMDGIRELDPDGIIVSPGPGIPQEAGVSMPIFEELSYPTLGVCLGHQALCAVHGAPVDHAPGVVHGKSSVVTHDGKGIYAELPAEFEAGRYHSLGVEREKLPDCLEETAWTDDEPELVMGVRHADRPHYGVQYHPESILTDRGKDIVRAFIGEVCSIT